MTSKDPQQLDTGWTFYKQVMNLVDYTSPPEVCFDITTTWVREIKLLPKIDNNDPPISDTSFEWVFISEVTINEIIYNKFARPLSDLVTANGNTNNFNKVTFQLTSWYGKSDGTRTLTRARRLNEILSGFASSCGCIFVSKFFKNTVNPVSGADLSHIMISQKSDCIFTGTPPVESSDPATKAIITFNNLITYLKAMFQVDWYIDTWHENEPSGFAALVIEHINFFRNNLSYPSGNPPVLDNYVDIDLNTIYPICLIGSNVYEYEATLPIREKFSFMEAWNIDFVGAPIEYTDCLTEGGEESYSASEITTDIDPVLLDAEASKEGFVMFHCDDNFEVISEIGEMSGLEIPNAHLSWANLHNNYWIYNRPLGNGSMNNKPTTFYLNRKLKNQKALEFPYCIQDFNPNKLIGTRMGNGEVNTAEYSLKTGNIKIELIYE